MKLRISKIENCSFILTYSLNCLEGLRMYAFKKKHTVFLLLFFLIIFKEPEACNDYCMIVDIKFLKILDLYNIHALLKC